MKKLIVITVFFLLLTGCKPSQATIEEAINQIQTALPTQTETPFPTNTPTTSPTITPTLIQISELNLESFLILPGDLPAGYEGGQIHNITNEQYNWVSNHGDYNIYQQIAKYNLQSGGVSVLVYESLEQVEIAYEELINGLGTNGINEYGDTRIGEYQGLGEKATFSTNELVFNGVPINNVNLVFVRCHAVIEVGFLDTLDISSLSGYAQRLDQRLVPLVCR